MILVLIICSFLVRGQMTSAQCIQDQTTSAASEDTLEAIMLEHAFDEAIHGPVVNHAFEIVERLGRHAIIGGSQYAVLTRCKIHEELDRLCLRMAHLQCCLYHV
jgi:hypothetical protein